MPRTTSLYSKLNSDIITFAIFSILISFSVSAGGNQLKFNVCIKVKINSIQLS